METETGGVAPGAPENSGFDDGESRNAWLDCLADLSGDISKVSDKTDALSLRVARLERRKGFFSNLDPEVKGLAVMLSLYIGVAFVLPLAGELVRKFWAHEDSLFPRQPNVSI